MNKNLAALAPQLVWKHFQDLCQIPHPSFHEEAIRAHIIAFAKEQGLEVMEDEAHNVLVRKPATEGMEDRKGIVLQAHVDMVPQKNGDKVFDFEKDAIEAYIDGDWVTANGTTLGSDNGIGVASIMAVLESKDIKHGAIEALFTATEESGMHGAFGLKGGLLKGDILLNLDSETEGELYVGCAGGLVASTTFNYKAEATPAEGYRAAEITIKGLKGGHSGIEIILQRANANKLMFRLINAVKKQQELLLCSVDGGGLRNAIPREAKATVMVEAAKWDEFQKVVADYVDMVVAEFSGIEDSIQIKAEEVAVPAEMIEKAVAEKLVKAVVACPDGMQSMSQSMKGLVQTSTNLARIVSDGSTVKLHCLLRSSVNSEKADLGDAISSVFELAGAEVKLSGGYDGWKPNMASPILKAMTESYEALYGVTPRVVGIHAGLECGIIGGPYPNLDMISFGPTICYPHSPDEKVEIASVAKFWDFLCHTLGNAPRK